MTILVFRNKQPVTDAIKHLNSISYPLLRARRDFGMPQGPRWISIGRVNKASPLSKSYEFFINYHANKPDGIETQKPELLTAVMLMPKEAIDFYLHSITE